MPSESQQISDTEALCQDMKNTIHLTWCWQLKCFASRLYHSNASAISIGLIILGESIVIRLIVQTYEKHNQLNMTTSYLFYPPPVLSFPGGTLHGAVTSCPRVVCKKLEGWKSEHETKCTYMTKEI